MTSHTTIAPAADDGDRKQRPRKKRASANPNIMKADGTLRRDLSKFDFPRTVEGHAAWCDWRIACAEHDKQNPPPDLDPEYRERCKKENELKRLKEKLAKLKTELDDLGDS